MFAHDICSSGGRKRKATASIGTQTVTVWDPNEGASPEERARSIRNALNGLPPELPTKTRIRSVIMHEILAKIQVPHGPGSTTGSQRHEVKIKLMNEYAAKSLLWDIPRQGPTKRGARRCFNWAIDPDEFWRLNKFLSLEDTRLGCGKAL